MLTRPNDRHLQCGVALIVSLVMLLAITLIGVFVMGNSRLEWLMTGNSHFQSDASFRAEAAARDGIAWARNNQRPAAPPPGPPADPTKASNWDNPPLNGAVSPATSITTPGVNQYVVRLDGCIEVPAATGTPGACSFPNPCQMIGDKCTYTYQVWGRASDSKGTNRIVQATLISEQRAGATTPTNPTGITETPLRISFAEINQ